MNMEARHHHVFDPDLNNPAICNYCLGPRSHPWHMLRKTHPNTPSEFEPHHMPDFVDIAEARALVSRLAAILGMTVSEPPFVVVNSTFEDCTLASAPAFTRMRFLPSNWPENPGVVTSWAPRGWETFSYVVLPHP